MYQGKTVGVRQRYRIQERIAKGAFSEVYRCVCAPPDSSSLSSSSSVMVPSSSDSAYAVKIIRRDVAERHKMGRALLREVKAMEAVGHQRFIVGLHDKFVSKCNVYLVMELAEGGTLLDFIKEYRQWCPRRRSSSSARPLFDSPLREDDSSTNESLYSERSSDGHLSLGTGSGTPRPWIPVIFKQLLLGLQVLHQHDIVHRDIKPENILLSKHQDHILLSDFGFACYSPPGHRLHRSCGTLRYCAPELLEESPDYDGRKVDVWAAGVTLYIMLFYQHPFSISTTDPDALLEHIHKTPYTLPAGVDAEGKDFISHLLEVDPQARWSVEQLLEHPWLRAVEVDDITHSVPSDYRTRPLPLTEVSSVDEEDNGFYDGSFIHRSTSERLEENSEDSLFDMAGRGPAGRSPVSSTGALDLLTSSPSESEDPSRKPSTLGSPTTTLQSTESRPSSSSSSGLQKLLHLLKNCVLLYFLLIGYLLRMACTLWARVLPLPRWMEWCLQLLPGDNTCRPSPPLCTTTVTVERRRVLKGRRKRHSRSTGRTSNASSTPATATTPATAAAAAGEEPVDWSAVYSSPTAPMPSTVSHGLRSEDFPTTDPAALES